MPIERKHILNDTPETIMQVVRVFLRDQYMHDLSFVSEDTTFYLLLGDPPRGSDRSKYILQHMLGAIQLSPFSGGRTELAFIVYDNELSTQEFCVEIIAKFRASWDPLVSRLEEIGYLIGDDLEDDKPWEKIPDYRWDRHALELWHKGYTAGEIARSIPNVVEKTVRNRLSVLRHTHGTDVVPTDDQRRRMKR